MQLPEWWIVVSGIAFLASILLNVALIIGGFVMWGKLGPLLTEARDQVKRIGDKAADITTTAKNTVDSVQQRTGQILGSAQEASAGAVQKLGAASTALTALFIVLRVASYARDISRKNK
jgi:hypothetical protein